MIPYGRAPKVYPLNESAPSSRATASELLIVEGDSAAAALNQVRDPASQAVIALQGKPLNCMRASDQAIRQNPTTARVIETLFQNQTRHEVPQCDTPSKQSVDESHAIKAEIAFDEVSLVMDPDADGIHCGVLMMAFFQRIAPDFVAEGRLKLIRTPMFLLLAKQADEKPSDTTTHNGSQQWIPAMDPNHAAQIEEKLRACDSGPMQKKFIRGLGSLNAELLTRYCMDRKTRIEETLTLDEVQRAVAMFAGV